MKKLLQIILLVFTLSMTSCYYDEIFVEEIPEGTEISFSADILPIFSDNNCTQCHNGNLNPDMTSDNIWGELEPYVNPGNANGSELYDLLQGNGHPLSLGEQDLQFIELWINQGAENN